MMTWANSTLKGWNKTSLIYNIYHSSKYQSLHFCHLSTPSLFLFLLFFCRLLLCWVWRWRASLRSATTPHPHHRAMRGEWDSGQEASSTPLGRSPKSPKKSPKANERRADLQTFEFIHLASELFVRSGGKGERTCKTISANAEEKNRKKKERKKRGLPRSAGIKKPSINGH